jgi:hypothetical protein
MTLWGVVLRDVRDSELFDEISREGLAESGARFVGSVLSYLRTIVRPLLPFLAEDGFDALSSVFRENERMADRSAGLEDLFWNVFREGKLRIDEPDLKSRPAPAASFPAVFCSGRTEDGSADFLTVDGLNSPRETPFSPAAKLLLTLLKFSRERTVLAFAAIAPSRMTVGRRSGCEALSEIRSILEILDWSRATWEILRFWSWFRWTMTRLLELLGK